MHVPCLSMMRPMRRHAMFCTAFLALFGGSWGIAERALGQQPPGGNVKVLVRVEPKTDAFKSATDKLREHIKQMREVVVRFHVSESPAKDNEYREKLRELIMEGSELHRAWTAAAIAEYREAPNDRKPLGDMLFRLLERNVESDRYDQMLELAQLLVDTGYDNPNLNRLMTLTAFASHDFDRFKQYAAKMIEQGDELTEEYQLIYLNIAQVEEAWNAELAARESDAKGEPLPRVLIRTTKGDIEVELYENQAPETVGNFINLVEQGFYDNHSFYRALKHFMAQTGCPDGDGRGGPGYFIRNEAKRPDHRTFFTATLGMALAQHPDTGGSQFFITFVPTPQLNNNFTAFGRVINGIDVLASLNRLDPEKKEEGVPPVTPDEIISIEVLFKRDHPYVPNKIDPSEIMGQSQ